jgi:hypothetical protein
MESAKDFLTESERERLKMYTRICNRYTTLREKFPEFKPYRVIRRIAAEEDMTDMGVKGILIRHGLYVKKTAQTQA